MLGCAYEGLVLQMTDCAFPMGMIKLMFQCLDYRCYQPTMLYFSISILIFVLAGYKIILLSFNIIK